MVSNTEFHNKVALITGASSGIGRASAIAFAQHGAKIMVVARNERALQELVATIGRDPADVRLVVADLTEETQIKRCVDATIAKFGGIDILVNCAGIIASGTIENTKVVDWDYMMNVNLRSVFLMMQQALPALIERKGNIINVSSVTGLRAFPNVLAYCVSKAGVDQLTRCAALELASRGVRVNAVNPGVTLTNLHRNSGMNEQTYQAFIEHSKSTHPLGRVGMPEEVAELILFLASPRAAWITGVTYSIDGGRAQTCAR